MKVGIIGAGNVGGNLTRRLTAPGHDVSVANSRSPEALTALAAEGVRRLRGEARPTRPSLFRSEATTGT